MDSAGDAEYFADSIFRLERAIANIGLMRLKPWGMTLSAYAAMKILQRQPEISLAQLSRRCYVRAQTMTRMVTDLERRGFVQRAPHARSKRAISLALTDLGNATLSGMATEVEKIYQTLDRVVPEPVLGELQLAVRQCAVEVEGEIAALRAGA